MGAQSTNPTGLEKAQDAMAALGLISGVVISGISLYVLLRKYVAPPPPTGAAVREGQEIARHG